VPAAILATKLYIPPSRQRVVLRPRLVQRLNEGLTVGNKLSLVSAPAGFGKTTLVSEWVAGCGRRAAWLSLDDVVTRSIIPDGPVDEDEVVVENEHDIARNGGELVEQGCQRRLDWRGLRRLEHGQHPFSNPGRNRLQSRDQIRQKAAGVAVTYLPPEEYVEADGDLIERVASLLGNAGLHVERGASWTTDAPFRETPSAIARWRDDGVLTADMEAASLYAFARARGRAVVCFAHVTNTMAQSSGDFEKGASNGALAALDVLVAVGRGLTVRSKTSAPAR
jgi:Phosphorylase superfamily